MQINYKINDKFDFYVILPIISLVLIGLILIYSATINHPTANTSFMRQLIFVFISIIVFLFIYFLPTNLFRMTALPLYLFSIFLLFLVLFVGREVSGSKSWINFGPIGFQPAEFGKIGTVLFMAHWLSKIKGDINNFKDIFIALLIGVVPLLLILAENETGIALVYATFIIGILFWAGISIFSLFVVLSPGLAIFSFMLGLPYFLTYLLLLIFVLFYFKRDIFTSGAIFIANLSFGILFEFIFTLLKPHQQRRIATFIDPNADIFGAGYNTFQAKLAIGSGGLFGKGFLEGNQTKYGFIPAQWTDFIYCVAGEEFGFLGSSLIIILFAVLILRILNISTSAKDNFSSLVVFGILMIILTHFIINIGMNIGIMPVIGLPLPFVSYGGSSLLVNIVLIAIVMNIYRNRKIQT